MFYKLSFRNASIFALIVLFATISLFPMDLSADISGDHDNLSVHDVSAQTSLSVFSYYKPVIYGSLYAGIWNSSDISVRYYYSSEFAVWGGGKNPIYKAPDSDKGWIQPGEWISFDPYLSYDMTGRVGIFTATSSVELGLKFDFNGDGVWDDSAMVSSSAQLEFEVKRKRR